LPVEIARIVISYRFGSATPGTRNYAEAKTTTKNGNTFCKIRFAQVWSPEPKIGGIKEN